MSPDARSRAIRATVLAGAVAVVALLPLFLTGAMAVQISRELAFGSIGLGLAVAAFRGAGAVTSIHLGRLTDRLGATRTIQVAATVAAIAALGIAISARNLPSLLAWLVLAGSAVALAQPAANRLLLNRVPSDRLGTAFGVKQSAPPGASLLAGAAVPLLAVTVGWRWGYVLAAVAAVVVLLMVRTPPGRERTSAKEDARTRKPLRNPRVILILAIAFGLGDATSSVSTTFLVDSQVAAGASPERAGTVLSIASACAILTRLSLGAISDRLPGGHLHLCAAMLGVGTVGLWLLSSGEPGLQMVVGGVLAFMGCWGYNGVFWYAMVRAYPDAPGRITGALSPGGLAGSTLGPVVFGWMVDQLGYQASWRWFVGLALCAAAVLSWAGRQLERAPGPTNGS